jgi:SAM-dependent methyltransferase
VTTAATAAVANVEQAAAWDGEEGDHWTEHEPRYDAVGRRLDPHLLEAAGVACGEAVLEVGCGFGRTASELARRVAPGPVLAVDLSRRMLKRARQRAHEEALGNVDFQHADAQVHPFDTGVFDLVISRYGAMFFGDPRAAFTNLHAALRPGGRLVLLTWAALRENAWLTVIRESLAAGRDLPEPPAAGPGPLGLSQPEIVLDILEHSGFVDIEMRLVREPLWFGADTDDALRFISDLGMSRGLLAGLDPVRQAASLERLRFALERFLTPDGVLLGSTSWLVTARRLDKERL